MVMSLAPVLTILARVLVIKLHKQENDRTELHDADVPGSSPGPVDQKVDRVGHKVPDG